MGGMAHAALHIPATVQGIGALVGRSLVEIDSIDLSRFDHSIQVPYKIVRPVTVWTNQVESIIANRESPEPWGLAES
jgi:hypothetical protein